MPSSRTHPRLRRHMLGLEVRSSMIQGGETLVSVKMLDRKIRSRQEETDAVCSKSNIGPKVSLTLQMAKLYSGHIATDEGKVLVTAQVNEQVLRARSAAV